MGPLTMAVEVFSGLLLLLVLIFAGTGLALDSTDTITSAGDNTRSGYQP